MAYADIDIAGCWLMAGYFRLIADFILAIDIGDIIAAIGYFRLTLLMLAGWLRLYVWLYGYMLPWLLQLIVCFSHCHTLLMAG